MLPNFISITEVESFLTSPLQGWLDLASARHSMGPLRVNSALLDLKPHSAATTLQVTQHDCKLSLALSLLEIMSHGFLLIGRFCYLSSYTE